jgi:hypothetical protein
MLEVVPNAQIIEEQVNYWFKAEREGERIAALAAVYSWRSATDRVLKFFPEVCDAIKSKRSGFERNRLAIRI